MMNPNIQNCQEDLRIPKKKTLTGPMSSSPATLDAVSELWFLEDNKHMEILEKWSKLGRVFHKHRRALSEVTQKVTVEWSQWFRAQRMQ